MSPDGQWIGFETGSGDLRMVSILGGPAVDLALVPFISQGASWGREDLIVSGSVGGGLYRLSRDAGEPQALTTPVADPARLIELRDAFAAVRNGTLDGTASGSGAVEYDAGAFSILMAADTAPASRP
ncbi:MAG: hypothetical protein CL476_08490 [Acidobacteria bacterium]|nr:hypothetical protein [Acidobacteriota bacterium]